MTAAVDLLIAQLRIQRTSSNYEPVVAIYDNLIAALSALDQSAGSVTSVGLDLDAGLYTVTGSPVTVAGTLTGTLNTQTANRIFGGPATGVPAKPTFRALVAADMPAGVGTVTSVGIAFGGAQASQWDTSGSPVTSSGNITLTMFSQSGNKVLASPNDGSSANPTFRVLVAADIPSLSATYLPLAGGTLTGPLVMTAGQTITPAQVAGIVGTTTNNDAATGSAGEYLSASISAPGVTLSSNVISNIGNIALGAGDWEVRGYLETNPDPTTTTSQIFFAINNVSVTAPSRSLSNAVFLSQEPFAGGKVLGVAMAPQRFSLSAPGTVYIMASVTFAVAAMTVYGFMSARRIR